MPVPNVAVVPRATLKLLPRISSQHDQYHPSLRSAFRGRASKQIVNSLLPIRADCLERRRASPTGTESRRALEQS